MCTGRDIEEDKRMAAFLQSKDYKGESWLTEDLLYQKWVEAGRPVQVYIPVIGGFHDSNSGDEEV